MGRFDKPNTLHAAALEELKKWKKDKGIKAIVPKTETQKLRNKQYLRRKRRDDAIESRKGSFGAASEVRIINPETTTCP